MPGTGHCACFAAHSEIWARQIPQRHLTVHNGLYLVHPMVPVQDFLVSDLCDVHFGLMLFCSNINFLMLVSIRPIDCGF